MSRASGDVQGRRRQLAFTAVAVVPSLVDLSLLVILRQSARLPLVVANALAIATASLVSYMCHRFAAERSNPYARWIQEPFAFLLVALVAGLVDIVLLRFAFATTGFAATTTLVLAKLVSMSVAGVIRLGGYRLVLADIIRENRVRRPVPIQPRAYRLSVVVPAFREPQRIARTVVEIREELQDITQEGGLEIVVVDDGSGDGTGEAARSAGADNVLILESNRGKGAAVRTGMLAAQGSVVCFTDADLAYHPRHLRQLLAEIERGWDVTIGNRQHPDSQVARHSHLRALGSRAINKLSAVVLLAAPLDTQCGLKGFRSDVAQAAFGGARIDGFAFDIEILHLVERAGWSVQDIPVQLDEEGATSTVSVARDTGRLIVDMLRIRQWSSAGLYDSVQGPEG